MDASVLGIHRMFRTALFYVCVFFNLLILAGQGSAQEEKKAKSKQDFGTSYFVFSASHSTPKIEEADSEFFLPTQVRWLKFETTDISKFANYPLSKIAAELKKQDSADDVLQDVPSESLEVDEELKTRLTELKTKHSEFQEQISSAESLSEEDKEALKKRLEQFKSQLDRAESELKAIEELVISIKSIPERLKAAEEELSLLPSNQTELTVGLTLDQLVEKQNAAELAVETRRKELDAIVKKIADRTADFQSLPKKVETAKSELTTAQKAFAAANKSPGSLSERMALERAKLDVLVYELVSEQLRIKNLHLSKIDKLLPKQRDLAATRLTEAENKQKFWQREVEEFRADKLRKVAENAEAAAKNAHPAVKDLANENAELLFDRAEYNQSLVEYSQRLSNIESKLDRLNSNFTNLQTKLEVAGRTKTIGQLLRRRRDELPRKYELRQIINDVERDLPQIQLDLIEAESERNDLADLSTLIEDRIEKSNRYIDSGGEDSISRGDLEQKVRDEYEAKREVLSSTVKDLTEFSKVLAELDTKSRQLLERTSEFSHFVDKHVLWIQSAEPIGLACAKKSLSAIASLFTAEQWVLLFEGIIERWKSNPIECVLAVAFFITVALLRSRLKKALRAANTRFSASRSLLFRPTLEATFYTLILSGLWPMLVMFIGWQLSTDPNRATLPGALSASLIWIGLQYLIASLLYHVTRSDGMAIHHFAWPKPLVTALRYSIGWIIVICLPLSFARYFFDFYEKGKFADSTGRFFFLASMVCWTVILWRLLVSLGKYLNENTQARSRNWLIAWRWFLIISMVITPVVLIIAATFGYYFSATQIGSRMQLTSWFLLLAVIQYSLLSRLLTIARQKITMRQMSFARLLAPRSDESQPPEEKTVDIDAIEKQVSQLVSSLTVVVAAVALWQVWADVTPAVQILDQVVLWDTVEETTQEVVLPDKTTTTETKTTTIPITLTNLSVAIAVLVLTWIVSRNLPGLLEITLLDRLPIDRGGRYAIAVVCRYILAATGIVIAANLIGIKWTSVQWLVAAMTVGLGFGLQEIFGNFVSGIIILLERPVRVGDMVTVSGTTGYVSRIQLRATTITDFDRRELIVPNKKFITDDVINHTLSDTTARMCIPVGIAYGSDTQLAHDLLLQIANESEFVSREPEPYVIFTAFGASSLDFELRVYLSTRDHIIEAQHSLHMTIDRVFREHNIEIAFPQQDIHIRSVDVK